MNCEEIQHELYVFGTMEPDERAELEAHLARGCATCRAAIEAARDLAVHLALAAPQREPPALRALPGPAMPRPAASPFWRWAFALSAAAAVALLIIASGYYHESRALQNELQSARGLAKVQRERERDLQRRLASYREAMRLVASPEAREVRFGPKQPSGRLFLQPRGLVMILSDLPQPPAGRTYELWLIAANRPAPIPAGVFHPDASGNALHLWQQPIEVGAVKAIAVSDEPPGGTPAPTGKILFSAPVTR